MDRSFEQAVRDRNVTGQERQRIALVGCEVGVARGRDADERTAAASAHR
jgi:hypothetical protein